MGQIYAFLTLLWPYRAQLEQYTSSSECVCTTCSSFIISCDTSVQFYIKLISHPPGCQSINKSARNYKIEGSPHSFHSTVSRTFIHLFCLRINSSFWGNWKFIAKGILCQKKTSFFFQLFRFFYFFFAKFWLIFPPKFADQCSLITVFFLVLHFSFIF